MPFNFKGIAPSPAKEESWKETLKNRVGKGKVVPIISNSFTNDLAFTSHQALVEGWADYIQYSETFNPQYHHLPHLTLYESVRRASRGQPIDEVKIKEQYLKFLKEALFYMAEEDPNISADTQEELRSQAKDLTVSEIAGRLNYPSLDNGRTNSLMRLAVAPLPIYITTSYHNFLEVALKKARKDPQTEICRWHDGLNTIPSVFEREAFYEPTPEQPLVYHLHGFDQYPKSLVLTEDDHLDFLTNISRDQEAIHQRVNQALTESSLVILGYSVRQWDFRVLFRGVIKPRPQPVQVTNVVAIQLERIPLEKEFVEKYLHHVRFEVEWASPVEFIQEVF